MMKLRREIDNLRELLHTLERSVSQKDKLVSNLVKSLEKEVALSFYLNSVFNGLMALEAFHLIANRTRSRYD